MEKNCIIIAPQAADLTGLYHRWLEEYFGSFETFYKMLTTPTTVREQYLNSVDDLTEKDFRGNTLVETITTLS